MSRPDERRKIVEKQNSGNRVSGMWWISEIINQPPEKVFAYIVDPENAYEFQPQLKEQNCEGIGLGQLKRWKREVGGIKGEGESLCVEYTPGQKLSYMMTTDLGELLWSFIFAPHQQGTRLIGTMQLVGELMPGFSFKTMKDLLVATEKEEFRRIKEVMEKKP